jgi:hypothetical protein
MTSTAAAVAAYGVPTRLVLPAAPLTDDEFGRVLSDCVGNRLLGLLGSAVGAGAFPVTDEQREDLEVTLVSWSLHGLRVEQALVRALDALSGAGVPARVIKGPAMSRTVYPESEQRVFGDVDILVPSGRVHDAVRTLREVLDTERVQPELRPGFDERFGKEVTLRYRGNLELDLHRIFVDGAFGLTIVTDDLFAPPYRFPLAGYELQTLPMPQRLLSACYHAALGDWPPRLVALRDVAQLVLREQPNLLDVLMMARAWRCEIVVARAVTNAWDTLELTDTPPIVTWARQFEPDRTATFLLRAHEGHARSFTRHLAALLVLRGKDRFPYARAIAFPQREYLEARGLSAKSHATRAVDKLRGR